MPQTNLRLAEINPFDWLNIAMGVGKDNQSAISVFHSYATQKFIYAIGSRSPTSFKSDPKSEHHRSQAV